jgi:hypothetical protein
METSTRIIFHASSSEFVNLSGYAEDHGLCPWGPSYLLLEMAYRVMSSKKSRFWEELNIRD